VNPTDPGAPGDRPTWGPPLAPPPVPPAPDAATCYLHPDRRASSVCRRCDRPICTDCMREAPVGWQCARCIHRDSRTAPVTQWRPSRGGTLGATRLTPVVIGILAVNVLVFLYEETNFDSVVSRFALYPPLTRQQPYRLLTGAFLHASFTHIALNMVSLIIVGPAVEAAVGRWRTVALYLLAAVGGEVLSFLLGPLTELSLGASGAIFGLMGAYFVLARRRGWDTSLIVPLIVINLGFSFLDPAIDWRAHVGGLLVGAAVAYAFSATESMVPARRRLAEPAVVVGVLAVLALLSRLPPGHVGI
jgi:membrane associated rhomboid family serine protease